MQLMRRMLEDFIHALLVGLALIVLVHTQDQSGFISIDCGLPKNSSYIEPTSGISYISDATFIDTGVSKSLSAESRPPHQQNLCASVATDSLRQNDYQPPAVVMSTATIPVDPSAPMVVFWEPDDTTSQYYVFMHFAELEVLAANETRAFNVSLNDKYWYGPLVPDYLSLTSIFSPTALSGGQYQFSLHMTENSTLPPILNAIEIYKVKDLSQSETDQGDGMFSTN
ncbi:Receptor-like protein kinase [Quillaja saponaria]|uniref:Receptor-like protein kinase n=1 Tax=Quillaja saponaria TaxID=32244 RepID=A0AAD7PPH7_QUISA|nr:Receptor-like protein kinase [Quillaja saponaria]